MLISFFKCLSFQSILVIKKSLYMISSIINLTITTIDPLHALLLVDYRYQTSLVKYKSVKQSDVLNYK